MQSQSLFFAASPLPTYYRQHHPHPRTCSLTRSTPKCTARDIDGVAERLSHDLPRLFKQDASDTGHYDLYAPDVVFRDPVTAFRGVKRYKDNISFLRRSPIFTDTTLDTYDVQTTDENTVTTRWAMTMTVRVLPWRPRITFTGISEYGVRKSGLITSHIDKWDSLNEKDNLRTGTPAAVLDVLRQLGPAAVGSGDKQTAYLLLRRAKTLELRDYQGARIKAGANNSPVKQITAVSGVWIRDGELTVNQVAAVRLVPGDNVAQKARDVTENILGEKWAVPHGAACVVTYAKQSIWQRAQVWEPPVRELWLQVHDVDTSVAVSTDAEAAGSQVQVGM